MSRDTMRRLLIRQRINRTNRRTHREETADTLGAFLLGLAALAFTTAALVQYF